MTITFIPEFELPCSSHANAGVALHSMIFALSAVLYVNTELAWYSIAALTFVLFIANTFYWFGVDEKKYVEYKASYVSLLDQLDVCIIKQKIEECGFGTSTERFLTSYLKKKHPNSIKKCQYETFNFFSCKGSGNQ
tara:strand:- start:466 stop:873 length:408 start_codon:yes stop_codon:yes gene_type:complete